MKKYIIIGLLALPFPAFASFDYNLSYGMSNSGVLELQDVLHEEGCFNVEPTGFFGLITFNGVKCFQAKYELPQTGFFGVMSRTQANSILAGAGVGAPVEEDASTSPKTSPPSVVNQPNQIIYLPLTDSPSNHPTTMPTISIAPFAGSEDILLSDDKTNVPLTVSLSSDDFSQDQLNAISTHVIASSILTSGTNKVKKYRLSFRVEIVGSLPEGAGTIKINVTATGYEGVVVGTLENVPQDGNTFSWRSSWQ